MAVLRNQGRRFLSAHFQQLKAWRPTGGRRHAVLLLCRCVPAGSKSKGEMCVTSLPCFQCYSQEISHWTFVYIHVLCLWLVHSNYDRKILPFFQKYTWTAYLDRRSFLSVFSPYFAFLILEFLKKIGHTGIAGTKKWLDQAVFPCWSNYHTLAGE